jgi:hypothetical protein
MVRAAPKRKLRAKSLEPDALWFRVWDVSREFQLGNQRVG